MTTVGSQIKPVTSPLGGVSVATSIINILQPMDYYCLVTTAIIFKEYGRGGADGWADRL